jgi:cell division septation protein DedD
LENILRLAGAIIEPASPKTPRRSSRRHSSAVRDHDAVPDSEDEADDSRETDSVVEDVAGDGEDEDDVVVTLVDDLTPRSTFKSISKPVNWKWALECVTRWELLPTLKWLKR